MFLTIKSICLPRFKHFSHDKHQYCDNIIHSEMKLYVCARNFVPSLGATSKYRRTHLHLAMLITLSLLNNCHLVQHLHFRVIPNYHTLHILFRINFSIRRTETKTSATLETIQYLFIYLFISFKHVT